MVVYFLNFYFQRYRFTYFTIYFDRYVIIWLSWHTSQNICCSFIVLNHYISSIILYISIEIPENHRICIFSHEYDALFYHGFIYIFLFFGLVKRTLTFNRFSFFFLFYKVERQNCRPRKDDMIPFPSNDNRFSLFVADHLLDGQFCTNPKSDRSLLSCLKVIQCSTSKIGDVPLYN